MIPRWAVKHPVTVAMLFVAGVLLGALSLRDLPVDLLPELEAPRIAVLLRSGDRPPEEVTMPRPEHRKRPDRSNGIDDDT